MDFADRIRKLRFVAPAAVFLYCLIYRGGILDGRAGIVYAMQRGFAELMLSLYLLEADLGRAARKLTSRKKIGVASEGVSEKQSAT